MKLPLPLLLSLAAWPGGVAAQQLAPVTDTLPGTRLRWEMVPVSGGTVVVPSGRGVDTVAVASFWIGRTEVPWELYDVFYLRLDLPREERATVDARARPSRPYGAPDRGFGHRGYPVISIAHDAAVRFAAWLSERTGHRYAVPTDAQWQRAADLAIAVPTPGSAGHAWSRANADGTTHPVAALAPDALGLHDLLGNAGEWVTGQDGTPWLRGGTFLPPVVALVPARRAREQPAWNQTDPQVPKSRWWLSDGPFAGLRLVRLP